MRPIDADALYEFITKRYSDLKGGSYPFNYIAFDMARLVEKAPTIDAVEVVRCKDCKHLTVIDEVVMCSRLEYHSEDVDLDHFCSYGERSEE